MSDDKATPEGVEEQEYRDTLTEQMWGDGEGTDDGVIEPLETPVEELPKEVDPWADVNPTVKEKLTELDTRLQNVAALEDRLKQAERRVGGLQNSLTSNGQRKLTAEQQAEVDLFKEDFPEFYSVVDHLTAGSNQAPAAGIDIDKRLEDVQAKMSERIELMQLSAAYPDFQEQTKSKDYQKWLIDQEPDFKNLTKSPRATDAIKVLDKYKADVLEKIPTETAEEVIQRRQKRLQSVQTVKGHRKRPPKAEADMTEAELRAKVAKEVWA